MLSKDHTPIKIEDDDDDEEESKNYTAPITVKEVKKDEENTTEELLEKIVKKEIEIQTDNNEIVAEKRTSQDVDVKNQTLKLMVKERLRYYEESMGKRIQGAFERLQRENADLRRQLSSCREKLNAVEKRAGKRSADTPLSPPSIPKKSMSSPVQPRNIQTISPKINTYKSPTSTVISPPHAVNNFMKTQPRFMKSPPAKELHGPAPPLIHHPRYGGPMQMVGPVQHLVGQPRPPFQLTEQPQQYILVDGANQIIGSSISGVNTQVVASNQGLRMASLQPEIPRMRVPLSPQNIGRPQNGVTAYQQLINIQRLPNRNPRPNHINNQRQAAPPSSFQQILPASRPVQNKQPELPKLKASISASGNGIILTWDYETSTAENKNYRKVECYHLFAYQARDNRIQPPREIKQYKKIGVVNALPLPMACTLTQFATGNVYFFAVLAVDINGREGEMSNPCIIRLNLDS